MSGRSTLRRAPTRRLTAVAGGILAVAVVVVAARAIDGPESTAVTEIDGRTWLTTRGDDGPVLVLANGISGLVEGQVSDVQLSDTDVTFAGSDAHHTLLTTPTEAVLLADGHQTAVTFPTTPDERSVIAGSGVVTAGATVELRRIAGDGTLGEPESIDVGGTPVAGVAPVVDAGGRAWVLVDDGDARHARAIGTDGRAGERRDADDAIGLTVVDGVAALRTAMAVEPLGDGQQRAVPGASGTLPAAAVATSGTWAVADGSRLAVTGGPDDTIDLGRPVAALAVWYGRVWAATDDTLVWVSGAGTTPVDGFRGQARAFTDGGRLWFVSGDTAAAIDRQQRVTVFTLRSVDLSLCVGDCSATDATRLIDDLPTTTTAPNQPTAAPPTTSPPISPPAVLPSLPDSSTTSTAPATVPPTTAPAPTAPATTIVTIPATAAPPTDPVPETAPPEPIEITLPPETVAETEPPPPPTSRPPRTTTTTTTTTEPPPPPGQLVLGVEGGLARATATYGFDGAANQCSGADGDRVGGELSWSGVASGSTYVEIDLGGGSGRGTHDFGELPPGELSVTFAVCGQAGTAAATVTADESRPSVGALSFSPGSPVAGDAVTASASLAVPDRWRCSGVTWVSDGALDADRCADVVTREFRDLGEGSHQIRVIVTFIRFTEQATAESSGGVTVNGTTTTSSTEPTTSSSTDPPTSSSDPTTVPSSDPTTIPPTDPTTIPPTDPTTIPPTEPTTIPPTDPTTIPPTDPTTPPPA